MNDFTEAVKGQHVPATLENIQARRRLYLFRLFSLSLTLVLGVIALAMISKVIFGSKYDYKLGLMFGVTGLTGVTAVLLSGVQLSLEIPIKQWFTMAREARGILDREQAADKELAETRAQARSARLQEYPAFHSYQAERAEREDRLNTLWSSDNYGFVNRLAVDRMQAEIENQGSRANTNLTIALSVAFVGIIILGWLAYDVTALISSPPARNENQMVFYVGSFLAKIALAISSNVFAFFFLSTYRRNLNEIRYFHNELTNYQTKIVGAYLAGHHKLTEPLSEALVALSKTERNFILKKGETTSDLSTKGLDQAETKEMIAAVASISKLLEHAVVKGSDGKKSAKKPDSDE